MDACKDWMVSVTTARQAALLGNYETAIVYYMGVIQQIQKHIHDIKEPRRREKLRAVSFLIPLLFCLKL